MNSYNFYLENSLEKIEEYLAKVKTRPIFFIGSGMSQRYIDAPTWIELLEQLIDENPYIDQPIQYYLQKYSENYPKIASVLAEEYRQYAWENREKFPEFTFESTSSNIHLKYKISSILENKLKQFNPDTHNLSNEIKLLKELNPQAIITTNYDNLLEKIFPKYESIVGQKVISEKKSTNLGHILKIHGSVEDPDSIVIEEKDYIEFERKQVYLHSKLLIYFMEHPVFFIGYGLNDENIKSILYDVKQITDQNIEPLIENMWFIDWSRDPINPEETPVQAESIPVGNGMSVKVNYIKLHSYDKLYKKLYQDSVDIELLKEFEETVYNVIKSDTITDLKVDIASLHYLTDRKKLLDILTDSPVEDLNEDSQSQSQFLTIAKISNPEEMATRYPLTATNLSSEVFNIEKYSWQHAYKLLEEIKAKTGVNLRSNNNKYHLQLEGKSPNYSKDMVNLLKKVKNSEPFIIELSDGKTVHWPPKE